MPGLAQEIKWSLSDVEETATSFVLWAPVDDDNSSCLPAISACLAVPINYHLRGRSVDARGSFFQEHLRFVPCLALCYAQM